MYKAHTDALDIAYCRGDRGAAGVVVAGAGAGDDSADPLRRRLRDTNRAGPVLGDGRAGADTGGRGGGGVVAAVAPDWPAGSKALSAHRAPSHSITGLVAAQIGPPGQSGPAGTPRRGEGGRGELGEVN